MILGRRYQSSLVAYDEIHIDNGGGVAVDIS